MRGARLAAGSCALVALVAALGAHADPALDAAQRQWRAAGLTSYEYGYHKFCECHRESPPETVVTVRGGEPVAVRHRPAGSDVEVPGRNPEYYWTVDGLFELVASALERGVTVRVAYDEARGFPREVYIDYDPNLIGDEVDVRLTSVTPL
jgi:hypothetical protein